MRTHKSAVMLISSIILIGLATALAIPPTSQKRPLTDQQIETRRREHGKLFDNQHGPKLRDLAAQQSRSVISVLAEEPYVIRMPDDPHMQLPFMQFAVCNADAIVIGALSSESPQLTPSETFVFTDYDVTVEQVIKDNSAAPIRGNEISVTREGGTVPLNGKIFRAEVEGFKSFTVGNRYVLFLRYLPATDDYLALAGGSVQLSGNKIIPLGKMPENQPKDADAFIAETNAAIAAKHCPPSK